MTDIINQAQLDEALDKWEAEYQPTTNHLVPDSSWNGWMFETYGEELEFVRSQPDNRIWTWVDCDEGTFLSAGYHRVNRLGYFITEKPWTDSCLVLQVDFYLERCDECGRDGEHADNIGYWEEELGEDHPWAGDRLCEGCFYAVKDRS